ncbi:hypothetical protein Thimo_1898 [Thioflavicoccus mobilis 8321]|uniref:Uncharacterized protein n=1 Tax=Thioflavicoccus mobilis 8321 TaxID=765912 RepID=L0GZC8_9GAMM|nr:hypothetical protein Thimo_1898 [Thioflavicoccus mobilis 8321]
MAETPEAKTPKKVSVWPKLVLWLLVIAFGIFYLREVNERGADERAIRHADRSAPAPTIAKASNETAASPVVATDAPTIRDAQSLESASSEPQQAAKPMPTSSQQAPSSPASATVANTSRPSPSSKPADTSVQPMATNDRPPNATDRRPAWVPDTVAESRARVLAEYEALLQSVEAERRAIWEQMNRIQGETGLPYPYPPSAPFGPPGGYGWPSR